MEGSDKQISREMLEPHAHIPFESPSVPGPDWHLSFLSFSLWGRVQQGQDTGEALIRSSAWIIKRLSNPSTNCQRPQHWRGLQEKAMLASIQKTHQNHIFSDKFQTWQCCPHGVLCRPAASMWLLDSAAWSLVLHQANHTKLPRTAYCKAMGPSSGHNSSTPRGTLLPQPHLVRQPQWPDAWGNGSLEYVRLTLAWAWGSYVPEFKSLFYALPGGHTDEMDSQSCPKHRFLIYNARNPCICRPSSWAERA